MLQSSAAASLATMPQNGGHIDSRLAVISHPHQTCLAGFLVDREGGSGRARKLSWQEAPYANDPSKRGVIVEGPIDDHAG